MFFYIQLFHVHRLRMNYLPSFLVSQSASHRHRVPHRNKDGALV